MLTAREAPQAWLDEIYDRVIQTYCFKIFCYRYNTSGVIWNTYTSTILFTKQTNLIATLRLPSGTMRRGLNRLNRIQNSLRLLLSNIYQSTAYICRLPNLLARLHRHGSCRKLFETAKKTERKARIIHAPSRSGLNSFEDFFNQHSEVYYIFERNFSRNP